MHGAQTAGRSSFSFPAGSYKTLPFGQHAIACFPHHAPDIHLTLWRFFAAHPFHPAIGEG
jgi:hypothetical protein